MSIPNNNNPKSMRSVLKGLRYISQMFDHENRESKMRIGNPTDVKHVAHIGWDGNNDAAPTWMTGFKEQSGSGTPNGTSSLQSIPEESEQKSGTASSSAAAAAGEPGNKHNRQTRKARNGNKEVQQDGEAKPSTLGVDQDGPKKGRKKKSKDSDGTKSRLKAADPESSSQPDQSHISSSATGPSSVEEE